MNDFVQGAPFPARRLLAIETSCDETSVAVLEDGVTVRSNRISSQEELHRPYGGVVPEIASRRHLEMVHNLLQAALDEAQLKLTDLDCLAVTHGPGLIGALLVGVTVAKSLALALDVPLIGVNHLEGHLYSPLLATPELEPPWVSLLVSGGHTMLVHVADWGDARVLGQTRDDAAGEAFDKVAKLLGLGYPGGPRVEQEARAGNPKALDFPRPMLHQGYEFSFSGLKTAVLYGLKQDPSVSDLCASFQAAAVDVLVTKTLRAARELAVKRVTLAGGVAANGALRSQLQEACKRSGLTLSVPPLRLCTDNAAMIGRAAWQLARLGVRSPLTLDAHASLPLGSWKNAQPDVQDHHR